MFLPRGRIEPVFISERKEVVIEQQEHTLDSLCFQPQESGIRIDRFLSDVMCDTSRSYLQKLIKDGHVTVNQKSVKPNYKVSITDQVRIRLPEPEPLDVLPEEIPLDILYEDADLLIVNKPKGMVVHPSNGHEHGTLVNAILYHCGDCLSGINGVYRPGIVHRIDMDTTGSLLVCKSDRAHQVLAQDFKDHRITRKYHAIVHGNLKEDTGTVNAPIGRHPIDRKKMSTKSTSGRHAVTHYKVLERFGAYTYIECELETGRTHQIRVHMASIGHPILGDAVYSSSKNSFSLQGQTLHAKILGIEHPIQQEYMEFDAPLPAYFEALLTRLRRQM
jgi:23S rRNA pseudouridine1911/1915/1917 synthase